MEEDLYECHWVVIQNPNKWFEANLLRRIELTCDGKCVMIYTNQLIEIYRIRSQSSFDKTSIGETVRIANKKRNAMN